jgi:hypothetical protein
VAELTGARYAANARLNASFRGPTPEAK